MSWRDICRHELVPIPMREAIIRYVMLGDCYSDFLYALVTNDLSDAVYALVTNDLSDAVARADSHNVWILPIYVDVLYNLLPSRCWGGAEVVRAWQEERAAKPIQVSVCRWPPSWAEEVNAHREPDEVVSFAEVPVMHT